MAKYESKRQYYINKLQQNRYQRELNNLILGANLNTKVYDDTNSSAMDLNRDNEIETNINTNVDSGVKTNRFSDTLHELNYNITNGLFDFFEGIGDAVITGIGAVGSWFGADDQWAKDAVNYDWSKDVAYSLDQLGRYYDPINLIESAVNNNWDSYNWDSSSYGNNVGEQSTFEKKMYDSSLLKETGDDFHQGVNNFAQVLGNQLPTIALAIATGGTSLGATAGTSAISTSASVAGATSAQLAKAVSLGTMGVSAMGRGAEEVFAESEENTSSEALLYGVLSGAVEVGTELIPFPGGNAVGGIIGKNFSGSIVKDLASSFVEEGIEEVISDIANPFLQLSYKNNESWEAVGTHLKDTFSSSDFYSGLGESFLMGGASALVIGGTGIAARRSALGKNGYAYASTTSDIIESKNKLDDLYKDYSATNKASTLKKIQKETNNLNKLTENLINVSEKIKSEPKTQEKILKYFTEKSFEGNIEEVNKAFNNITAEFEESYNYSERKLRGALTNFYDVMGYAPEVKIVETNDFNARYKNGIIEINKNYEGDILPIINHELSHSAFETLSNEQLEEIYNEFVNSGIKGEYLNKADNSRTVLEATSEQAQERAYMEEVLAYYIEDSTKTNLSSSTLSKIFNKQNIKRSKFDKSFNKFLKSIAKKQATLGTKLSNGDLLVQKDINYLLNEETTLKPVEGQVNYKYSDDDSIEGDFDIDNYAASYDTYRMYDEDLNELDVRRYQIENDKKKLTKEEKDKTLNETIENLLNKYEVADFNELPNEIQEGLNEFQEALEQKVINESKKLPASVQAVLDHIYTMEREIKSRLAEGNSFTQEQAERLYAVTEAEIIKLSENVANKESMPQVIQDELEEYKKFIYSNVIDNSISEEDAKKTVKAKEAKSQKKKDTTKKKEKTPLSPKLTATKEKAIIIDKINEIETKINEGKIDNHFIEDLDSFIKEHENTQYKTVLKELNTLIEFKNNFSNILSEYKANQLIEKANTNNQDDLLKAKKEIEAFIDDNSLNEETTKKLNETLEEIENKIKEEPKAKIKDKSSKKKKSVVNEKIETTSIDTDEFFETKTIDELKKIKEDIKQQDSFTTDDDYYYDIVEKVKELMEEKTTLNLQVVNHYNSLLEKIKNGDITDINNVKSILDSLARYNSDNLGAFLEEVYAINEELVNMEVGDTFAFKELINNFQENTKPTSVLREELSKINYLLVKRKNANKIRNLEQTITKNNREGVPFSLEVNSKVRKGNTAIDTINKIHFKEISLEEFVDYFETTNNLRENLDIKDSKWSDGTQHFAILYDSSGNASLINYFEKISYKNKQNKKTININNFSYKGDANSFARQLKSFAIYEINNGATSIGVRANIVNLNNELHRALSSVSFKAAKGFSGSKTKMTNIKTQFVYDPLNKLLAPYASVIKKVNSRGSFDYKEFNNALFGVGEEAIRYLKEQTTNVNENQINDKIIDDINKLNEDFQKLEEKLGSKKEELDEVRKSINVDKTSKNYYEKAIKKAEKKLAELEANIKIEKRARKDGIILDKGIDENGNFTTTYMPYEYYKELKNAKKTGYDFSYELFNAENEMMDSPAFLSPNFIDVPTISYRPLIVQGNGDYYFKNYLNENIGDTNTDVKLGDRKAQGEKYQSQRREKTILERIKENQAATGKSEVSKAVLDTVRNNEMYVKFQMDWVNNAYVLEKELQKLGVDKNISSSWSKTFRSSSNISNQFIENGIILNDDPTRQRVSLLDAEQEIYDISKKIMSEKHLSKKEYSKANAEATKYASLYLYNNLQIDSNNMLGVYFNNFIDSQLRRNGFSNLKLVFERAKGDVRVDSSTLFPKVNDYLKTRHNEISKATLEKLYIDDLLDLQNIIKADKVLRDTQKTDILKFIAGWTKYVKEKINVKTVFGKIADASLIEKINIDELEKSYPALKESLLQRKEEVGNYIWESDFNEIINNYLANDEKLSSTAKKQLSELKSLFREFTNDELLKANEFIVKKYGDGVINFANKIYSYLDDLQKYRIQEGLITGEEYETMKEVYPHYVPTPREQILDGSFFSTNSVNSTKSILKREGSDKLIKLLQETIANQTQSVVLQGQINRFGNYLYKTIPETNYTKSKEVVLDPEARMIVGIRSVEDLMNVDLNQTIGVEDGNTLTFFSYETKKSGEVERVIKKIKLSDFAMQPIKSIVDEFVLDDKFFVRSISKINSTFRSLVTDKNPFFIGRNLVRDLSDALFTTKNNSVEFIKNYSKNLVRLRKNNSDDNMLQLFKAYGGMSSTQIANNNAFKSIKDSVVEMNKSKWSKKLNVFNLASKANEIIELVPRFTEFELSLKRYLNSDNKSIKENSILLAIRDSADITTDFSRHGIFARTLNRTLIPFLNAQIQGFSKLNRFIIEPKTSKEWAKLIGKAMAYGLGVELIFELLNRLVSGDDWEAIPEYTKNSYLLIPVGNGNYIKIPRGRIIGTVQIFFREALRVMNGEASIDEATKDFFETASTNLAPVDLGSGIRTIFSPITDMTSNLTWYGQSIDKQSDLNKYPYLRYDENTSELAKVIGKAFNYSPKRIDYLLEQYSGVVGDILLPAMTKSTYRDFSSIFNFVKNNTSISAIENFKYRGEAYELLNNLLYEKNAGNTTAGVLYSYLNRELTTINELEDELDLISDEASKYTLYLTLREAYMEAIENVNLLSDKLVNIGSINTTDRFQMTEAYRQVFGAEYALDYYNDSIKNKADISHQFNISYDAFYDAYFGVRGMSSKQEAVRYINRISGLTYNQRLLLQYFCGLSMTESETERIERLLKQKGLL